MTEPPSEIAPIAALAALPDITAQLQGEVDRGENYYLFPGDYAISDTIRVHRRHGWTLEGAGRGQPGFSLGGWNGRSGATCLVWTGAGGKPMFDLSGSIFCNIRDIGFSAVRGGPVTPCDVGFLFPGDPGFGTGTETVFRDVAFFGFPTAIQCGLGVLDHNCADIKIDSAHFAYCDRGLLVKNDQGVNYVVNGVSAERCKTLFHFERGGCLFAHGGFAAFVDTVLKVDSADVNNGVYSLDGWKTEQTSHPTCLVDATAAWLGHVSVENVHAASAGTLFKIGPGLALTVEKSVLLSAVLVDAKGSSDRLASAEFDRCTFYGGLPRKGTNAEIAWRSCRAGAKRMTDGKK